MPQPSASGDRVEGTVVRIDRFGNLVTNIPAVMVEQSRGRGGVTPRVSVADEPSIPLVSTYSEVPPGAACALAGSTGHIEVAVNGGSAARTAGRGPRRPRDGVYNARHELRSHRGTPAARTVRPRMGGPRSGAAHPRTGSRAPVRPDASSRRWPISACSASRSPPSTAASGTDYISLGLASEELEYVDTSLRVILSVHVGLNSLTLLSWGTDDQKRRYLVPQAQGRADRDLRPHRAVGRQRRARDPDGGREARRPLRPHRARRCGSRLRTWRTTSSSSPGRDLEKKKRRDPSGISGVHRRTGVQGVLERHAEGEVGHPGGQHRLLQDGRGRGARRECRWPAWRGIQDRDVRARPGALHGRRRRHRPDPRLPRRVSQVRARAQGVRRARSASTSW